MTIRSIITLLAVPLFLGLALVNGALLYFQDRAEMQRALNDQALSAAITIAEFVREMDDPAAQLKTPVPARAMRAALGQVADLDGLYLVEAGRAVLPLHASRHRWNLASLRVPDKAHSFSSGSDRRGDRWVTALAPAGNGRFVAARFSAEAIHDHLERVRRDMIVIAAALAILASGLAIFVARRITRELDANRRALGKDRGAGDGPAGTDLRIREARDLADAARLMAASQRAADDRRQSALARSEEHGDRRDAVRKTQSALFSPTVFRSGDCEIAMRLCGDVPAGSFFAYAPNDDGGTLVIGCCRGDDDVGALAAARDARRLIERCGDSDAVDRTLARLRSLYPFEALEHRRWRHGACGGEYGEGLLLSIADAATAEDAAAWCRASAGMAPAAILANLDVMLTPNAIFALVGPAISTDGLERGVGVGLNREDGAEAADVKDLAHRRSQS